MIFEEETKLMTYTKKEITIRIKGKTFLNYYHSLFCKVFRFLFNIINAIFKLKEFYEEKAFSGSTIFSLHLGFDLSISLTFSILAKLGALQEEYPCSNTIIFTICILKTCIFIVVWPIQSCDWDCFDNERGKKFFKGTKIFYGIITIHNLITLIVLLTQYNGRLLIVIRWLLIIGICLYTWILPFVIPPLVVALIIDLFGILITCDLCRRVPAMSITIRPTTFYLFQNIVDGYCVFCNQKVKNNGVQLRCESTHISHVACLEKATQELRFCPECLKKKSYTVECDLANRKLKDPQLNAIICFDLHNISHILFSHTENCLFCFSNGMLFQVDLASPKRFIPICSGLHTVIEQIHEQEDYLILSYGNIVVKFSVFTREITYVHQSSPSLLRTYSRSIFPY